MEEKLEFKVIIVGSNGVGKKTLLNKLEELLGADQSQSSHNREYKKESSLIGEDIFYKIIQYTLYGHEIMVHLYACPAEERLRSRNISHLYHKVDGVLLLYSVEEEASYVNLSTWVEECKHYLSPGPCQILWAFIGNKIDRPAELVHAYEVERLSQLDKSQWVGEHERRFNLPPESLVNHGFISALEGTNILDLWQSIVEKLYINYELKLTKDIRGNERQPTISLVPKPVGPRPRQKC